MSNDNFSSDMAESITLEMLLEKFSRLDPISRMNAYKKIIELLDEYEKNPDNFIPK